MASFFLDDTRRTRTVWRFAIFGCGFLAIQIVVGILMVVGLVVYLAATGTSLDALTRNPRMFEDWQIPLQIIASVPLTAATFGLVWICRKHLDRRSLSSLGLHKPGRSFTESVEGGFLTGSIPVVAVIVILLGRGGLAWEGVAGSLQTALLVPTFAVMAFFEEIVCRGYLLQNLIDIRRPVFGILFSSVVFWLLHSLNPAAWSSPIVSINLFGAGVVLALAYRSSGNIWFPTAMHFGWNLAQGVLFQLPVSGIRTDGLFDVRLVDSAPVWLTGGAFGIEGSILTTLSEVCLAALLGFVLRNCAPGTEPVEPTATIFLE
jgi:membrane protease YdiL (CAAX protease family)